MVEKVIFLAGEVIATDVSAEEYMEKYAADFHEWINGVVIKVAAASLPHARLIKYLILLFETYFGRNPIGEIIPQPFVMELEEIGSKREPDLLIVLNENLSGLGKTKMKGAADICIEIVSPESVARDYNEKFVEYEKGGVKEYWIIDPTRKTCSFHRLENQAYLPHNADTDGNYQTPLLPKLKLHVPTLWLEELPKTEPVVEAVKKMFERGD